MFNKWILPYFRGTTKKVEISEPTRVAIIGAGVGGATSAYFLKETLGNQVHIDVFEDQEVGGRAKSFEYEGKVYELGASVVYHGNRYFRQIADKVGAKRCKLRQDGTILIIYNGENIVFKTSWFSIWTMVQIFRRYGLVPLRYGNLAKQEFMKKFSRVYDYLNRRESFSSPTEMLKSLGLYDFTQKTARDVLMEKWGYMRGAQVFADELAASVNRVNYNQGMDVNGFAGLVSYLPVADSNLFNLKAGNDDLAVKSLEVANARVVKSRVKTIGKMENGLFEIGVDSKDNPTHSGYNAVIVAAPIEDSGLQFSGVELDSMPKRKFQKTTTTYVRGNLKPSYFHCNSLPKRVAVCMTENAKTPFSSLAFKEQYSDGTQLFKIFSTEFLSEDVLDSLFQNPTLIKQESWEAYPLFDPPEKFNAFSLAPGLFYNNAIENSASAMEMSILAARNAVNLFLQTLARV